MPDTLESVRAGCETGADCVEVDVRLLDGRLILSHNVTDRSDAQGLAEVFRYLKTAGTAVNCDLKEPRTLYPVLELAEDIGLKEGQLFLSGAVSCDLLAADPDVAERAQVLLNVEEVLKYRLFACSPEPAMILREPWSGVREAWRSEPDRLIGPVCALAKELKARAVNLPWEGLTDDQILLFGTCGMQVSVWTVNDTNIMKRMIALKPMNVTTKCPRMALALRGEGIS